MEENKDNKTENIKGGKDRVIATIGAQNEHYDKYKNGDTVKVFGVPHTVTSVETKEDGTRLVRARPK